MKSEPTPILKTVKENDTATSIKLSHLKELADDFRTSRAALVKFINQHYAHRIDPFVVDPLEPILEDFLAELYRDFGKEMFAIMEGPNGAP